MIVDDERLARQELKRLLAPHPSVAVIGEARNVEEAAEAVARLQPDLLFLDIKLPGGSGFDLLDRLDRVPEIIFTTAYDAYATRAFEVDALDYLVKPIEPDRLAAALERLVARRGAAARATAGRGDRLGEEDRVFVRDGERCWLVRLAEVVLLESEGNYTRLRFGNERPLIHRSLRHLDGRLDPRSFFRANRRQIVNLRRVVRLEPIEQGRLIARLENGVEVEMSRRRAQLFREMMSL